MRRVLDAMITNHGTASVLALQVLAQDFPVEAAILASRLPPDQAQSLFLHWYGLRGKETGDNSDSELLARLAAMLLAKHPPPGFAASVLAEAEESLIVHVKDPGPFGFGLGYGEGGSCDCGSEFSDRSWPPHVSYHAEVTLRTKTTELLAQAGEERIYLLA